MACFKMYRGDVVPKDNVVNSAVAIVKRRSSVVHWIVSFWFFLFLALLPVAESYAIRKPVVSPRLFRAKKENFDVSKFVKCSRERGLQAIQLKAMMNKAEKHVLQIDRESTVPHYSHLFFTFMNVFVALDILSVSITGVYGTQFSNVIPVYLEGLDADFVKQFFKLQGTRFSGIQEGKELFDQFFPWHIWDGFKHRGVGDVDLLAYGKEQELHVKVCNYHVPYQELKGYVGAAKDLVEAGSKYLL